MTRDDAFPRAACAIAGAATFGIGLCEGHSALEMTAKAGLLALEDAGLGLADVDGLFTCLPEDLLGGLAVAEYLGVKARFVDNNRTGGSSFLNHLMTACFMISAGYMDTALICYGSNQRSAAGRLVSALRGSVYEAPHGARMPIGGYALAASRHMHDYGTTRKQLGAVALAARAWARLNPEAFRREPLDMQEYLAARMVSSPLGSLDCCLVTDGAAAVVVTALDRACDLRKKPVAVLGAGAETTHKEIAAMPDLCVTGAKLSGRRAYAAAGYGPADMDMVQLYDAFTINTILFLENLGFCPKGEGGRFVQDGAIAPGGALPVNTNGGGLSCVHPGMYGLFTLVEAVCQIRGEAGERQLAAADLALCHGNGGVLSSQTSVILGSMDTV
ncbi:acetyl-CoA acetyltransferase [Paracoccus pantotrophus]|uniref:acetyl-CoA acetyltransferase n=1 Tax=Paracoccus pantotrophus TaxID=82367 RepID=UPI0035AFF0A5